MKSFLSDHLAFIARVIATKPLWYFNRLRHYPVKYRWQKLYKITHCTEKNTLAILTTPNQIIEGYWALWSWARFAATEFAPQLYIDGPIPPQASKDLQAIVPTAQIKTTDETISPRLLADAGFRRLYQHYPCGKKLALLLTLQEKNDVLYADSDVLLFRPPTDILSQRSLNRPLFMQEEHHAPEDPWIAAEAARRHLRLFPTLNSGLLYIPHHSLDIDLACDVLSHWYPPCQSWVIEQTMVNLLFSKTGAIGLPPRTYVINTQRQFFFETDIDYRTVVARHFVTPVRHLMYIKGYKILLSQALSFQTRKQLL